MIEIDRENAIAIVTISGSVRISDLQSETTRLLSHPEHRTGMDEIWELHRRELIGDTPMQFEGHAKFVGARAGLLARRVAFVVGRDLQYGLVRMWESCSVDRSGQEDEILRDLESAKEWILQRRGNSGENEGDSL